ncbi:NAD(P)/FAD-dependent oxidoreductase [Paraburkholderia aspalathi]|uniref:NAD(P)/FAD-dependent oxidoreductase n=1 Tax=Paraburkholderia aspalathi TaxID=1324617 RepID=UPI001B2A282B|nr:FAD-binding oxidoreductase [Paraburkholderia aspalathi]CAE6738171.1 Hydrogen cyanide synthase subunit HcnC [Paraburkholderia aspalathi]
MKAKTDTADVIIIGGGIVGCSTAYNLARRGARVVVLEKEDVAQEASGRNRGNVRLQLRSRLELPIAMEAVRLWESADEELGLPTEFRKVGNLLVTYHDNIAEGFGKEAERHRDLGLDAHVLSLDQIRELVPGISQDIVSGFLTTDDGHVNPQKATWAFATAARRLGADFRTGTRANELLVENGHIVGVRTEGGDISAPVVLNAGGVRAPELMKPLGIDLPISPAKHQILVTARMPLVTKPYLRCAGPRVSFGQTADGTLLLGMGPAQSVGFDTSISRAHIANIMRETIRLVPPLAAARVVRAWTGWFEMTPDDHPIIEPVESVPGLYVSAGFSGHGFALGPAIGRLMASLILDGTPTHPIDGFALSRFQGEKAKVEHEPDSLVARLGRLTAEGLH